MWDVASLLLLLVQLEELYYMHPLQCYYITGTWFNSMTSKITENQCWRHYFSPLMTIIYDHQNLFKYIWTGLKNLVAKNKPNMDSSCFMRLVRMIWQIPRRHYSTTQYQPHSLSSLCYLKIYLKSNQHTSGKMWWKGGPKTIHHITE